MQNKLLLCSSSSFPVETSTWYFHLLFPLLSFSPIYSPLRLISLFAPIFYSFGSASGVYMRGRENQLWWLRKTWMRASSAKSEETKKGAMERQRDLFAAKVIENVIFSRHNLSACSLLSSLPGIFSICCMVHAYLMSVGVSSTYSYSHRPVHGAREFVFPLSFHITQPSPTQAHHINLNFLEREERSERENIHWMRWMRSDMRASKCIHSFELSFGHKLCIKHRWMSEVTWKKLRHFLCKNLAAMTVPPMPGTVQCQLINISFTFSLCATRAKEDTI